MTYRFEITVVIIAHFVILVALGTISPISSLGSKQNKKLVVQTVQLNPTTTIVKAPPLPEKQVEEIVAVATPEPKPKPKTKPQPKAKRPLPKKKESSSPKLSDVQKERLQKARAALSSKKSSTTSHKQLNKVSVESDTLLSGFSDKLTGALRKNLILPEYGEVKVKLTLLRSGEVKKVEILSHESRENRKAILAKLKGLKLAPFGNNFPGEKEHDFVIVLSNDI